MHSHFLLLKMIHPTIAIITIVIATLIRIWKRMELQSSRCVWASKNVNWCSLFLQSENEMNFISEVDTFFIISLSELIVEQSHWKGLWLIFNSWTLLGIKYRCSACILLSRTISVVRFLNLLASCWINSFDPSSVFVIFNSCKVSYVSSKADALIINLQLFDKGYMSRVASDHLLFFYFDLALFRFLSTDSFTSTEHK